MKLFINVGFEKKKFFYSKVLKIIKIIIKNKIRIRISISIPIPNTTHFQILSQSLQIIIKEKACVDIQIDLRNFANFIEKLVSILSR